MNSLADRIEKILNDLASQQAIPDDSWRTEWEKVKADLPQPETQAVHYVVNYDEFDMKWEIVSGPHTALVAQSLSLPTQMVVHSTALSQYGLEP